MLISYHLKYFYLLLSFILISLLSRIYCSTLLILSYSPLTHKLSCIPGWPSAHCVAEDNPEFLILMPPLPMCWESRYVSPCWFYVVLGIESQLHTH